MSAMSQGLFHNTADSENPKVTHKLRFLVNFRTEPLTHIIHSKLVTKSVITNDTESPTVRDTVLARSRQSRVSNRVNRRNR